jgi:hypothetical protein
MSLKTSTLLLMHFLVTRSSESDVQTFAISSHPFVHSQLGAACTSNPPSTDDSGAEITKRLKVRNSKFSFAALDSCQFTRDTAKKRVERAPLQLPCGFSSLPLKFSVHILAADSSVPNGAEC